MLRTRRIRSASDNLTKRLARSLTRATARSNCWALVGGGAAIAGSVVVVVMVRSPLEPLSRPQPAKRPRCQQAIHQPIEQILQRGLPWLAPPDGGRDLPHAIRQKPNGSHHPKHMEVRCTCRDRVGNGICNEE